MPNASFFSVWIFGKTRSLKKKKEEKKFSMKQNGLEHCWSAENYQKFSDKMQFHWPLLHSLCPKCYVQNILCLKNFCWIQDRKQPQSQALWKVGTSAFAGHALGVGTRLSWDPEPTLIPLDTAQVAPHVPVCLGKLTFLSITLLLLAVKPTRMAISQSSCRAQETYFFRARL